MEVIKFDDREVILNPKHLIFSDATINQFLTEFAGNYDYYSEAHAVLQHRADQAKAYYEELYDEKFVNFKENGCSDKLAEGKATVQEDVMDARKQLNDINFKCRRMYSWLRSLDKAYESCKEFCYNMRKELDKIYGSSVRELNDMISSR